MSGLASIDLTETITLTTLRSFLLSVLPSTVEVVRGQVNRVPSPQSANFVIMTPILRVRLSTNIDTYVDQPMSDPPVGQLNIEQPTRETVQLDVHGLAAGENAQIITTAFRDTYACDFFRGTGLNIAPLYAEDPRQIPFITGEQQFDTRWVVDLVLQVNPIITLPQQFADELKVTTISVEAAYPPT